MSEITERLRTAIADRYVIERELGQGGMATVYLAHDVKHDRKVALKVLRPELAAVIGAERFLQEIKVTANLQHSHILPLYDSGAAEGFLFYVMPYVEGETLRTLLAREKQLDVDDAVDMARKVASALEHAHKQGVIHRDIKPENILIRDGDPVVADFGIALALSHAGGSRLTETGLSIGTPHYMSPEQAMGDRELDARSDVYSLAAVLYELLTGEPPYTGTTAQAIVARVITEDPRPILLQRRTVPEHVADTVHKALNKLPADRFHSAAEFADALVTPGAVPTRAKTAVTAAAVPGKPWRRVAMATSVVAVVMAGLAWFGWRQSPPLPVMRVAMSFPEGERIRAVSTHRFAIAPDGSRIAYVGPDSGGTQIWVREMNTLAARPLPGTTGGLAPFFSPDGRSVAFLTGISGDLKVVPVAGGPALTLVQDSTSPWGGDWTEDGWIYFTDARTRISRVPATGGAVTALSVPDSATGAVEHDWPQAIPGGRYVLLQVWRTSIGDAQLGVLDLESGEVEILVDAAYGRYVPTGHIVYSTFNGSLLVAPFDEGTGRLTGAPTAVAEEIQTDPFSGSAQFAVSGTGILAYLPGGGLGSQQVEWVDRTGAQVPVDTSWRGSFGTLALSPDGRQLAISSISGDGEHIWVKRLPDGPISRLTFGGTGSVRPTWTPDGRRISFISNRGGNLRQAYVQRADGSVEAESLMADPRQVDQIDWLPDGSGYLFRTGSAGTNTRDVHAVFVGDTTRRTLVAGRFDEFAPAVSPDGQWFAYVSNESGRNEVFVRRIDDPGAGRTLVSIDGGEEPRWAHSGRELFYRTPRGGMMAVDATLGAELVVGTPRVLFEAPNMGIDGYHHAYAVSRDDRRFLMINRAINDVTELVLVVNWFEELRR